MRTCRIQLSAPLRLLFDRSCSNKRDFGFRFFFQRKWRETIQQTKQLLLSSLVFCLLHYIAKSVWTPSHDTHIDKTSFQFSSLVCRRLSRILSSSWTSDPCRVHDALTKSPVLVLGVNNSFFTSFFLYIYIFDPPLNCGITVFAFFFQSLSSSRF